VVVFSDSRGMAGNLHFARGSVLSGKETSPLRECICETGSKRGMEKVTC
jgi:hypothetical protein